MQHATPETTSYCEPFPCMNDDNDDGDRSTPPGSSYSCSMDLPQLYSPPEEEEHEHEQLRLRASFKRPPPISTLASTDDVVDNNNAASSESHELGTTTVTPNISAGVARRKPMGSPASTSSAESLNLPDLNEESRNDREWIRFPFAHSSLESAVAAATPFDVKTTCSEDGAEWEVSLRPVAALKKQSDKEEDDDDDDDNGGEEKKTEAPSTPTLSGVMMMAAAASRSSSSSAIVGDIALSPTTLELQTEKIIQEARAEALKWKQSPTSSTDGLRRQEIIQRALKRASARSKEEAKSIAATTASIQHLDVATSGAGASLDGAAGMEEPSTPKMRTNPEAISVTTTTTTTTHTEVPQSLSSRQIRPPEGGDETLTAALSPRTRALQRLEGRPPMSPMTPTGIMGSNISYDPHERFPTSPAESSLGSIEDYEQAMNNLPIQITAEEGPDREKVLRQIDGIVSPPVIHATRSPSSMSSIASTAASLQFFEEEEDSIVEPDQNSVSRLDQDHDYNTDMVSQTSKKVKKVKTVVIKSSKPKKDPDESSFGSWFNFLWGGPPNSNSDHDAEAEEYEESLAPMSCGRQRLPLHDQLSVPTSLVRVASRDLMDGYAEAINAQELYIDPRMPEWIDNQFADREKLPKDGTYQLGESRTVIVHELIRGAWTWCTAWSPDGRWLAIGTENHHLAVVDTFSSSVWRIKHDKRVSGTSRESDATHSIRSIAWGAQFIAIGGVGSSVSILAPTEPYPILHRITPTGFVGSLDWLKGSNTLLIGSRNGKAMIVKIWAEFSDASAHSVAPEREIRSTVLHTIDRERAWVNVAKFSPGGTALAVGDSKGILGVYSYEEKPGSPVTVSNIANFKLEDSILDLDWSPDGQWLYAGGEDFVVTVINTQWWEAVHRIKRDRWVQFISSSRGGSHVALGGVSSEVSILDVDRGWDAAINVSLKGLVPLSAKWHPQDQYLVVTGQNNSILAVETTPTRYVSGHFLRSVSPILAIEFSPDGRMAAIGNEAGVITIFKLSGTTFITTYELVLDGDGSLSIEWSMNGAYLAVVAGSKVVVIAKSSSLPGSAPPNASGFHVAQVIRDFGLVQDVAISPKSRYLAISGSGKTRFLDATSNFKCILEVENSGTTLSNSWSPDGSWFATIGKKQNLLIYDTSSPKPADWQVIFTVHTEHSGMALAWGPQMLGGLQYCAYGGEGKKVFIMEIRTKERTWETVLGIPREGVINDLDWNAEGLVAAAIGNGTVTVMDLSYLQSGWAVNEMDYNWQRQALTCFTEIRRNKGKNSMKAVRWIPSAPGSDSLLAVGGTDGEVEIVDLTDRQRCSGFNKVAPVS